MPSTGIGLSDPVYGIEVQQCVHACTMGGKCLIFGNG